MITRPECPECNASLCSHAIDAMNAQGNEMAALRSRVLALAEEWERRAMFNEAAALREAVEGEP